MPQIFQVLRCYKCLVFQVHQTKKSNKFACKMCGEKQSIKRHYGLGNGLECRKHVQKLNVIRGEMDEFKSQQSVSTGDEEGENENNTKFAPNTTASVQNNESKWSDFVENTAENLEVPDTDDDKMFLNHTEVVLELPKKRRKILGKRSVKNENNKTSSSASDCVESSNDNYMVSKLPKHEPCPCFSRMHSSNVIQKPFTPPMKKNSSPAKFETPCDTKWNELDNESDKSTLKAEQLSQTNNVLKIKYKPPETNKNSKWAKFAEDSDHEENNLETPKNTQNDPKMLFSLCDDNHLDEYLTI